MMWNKHIKLTNFDKKNTNSDYNWTRIFIKLQKSNLKFYTITHFNHSMEVKLLNFQSHKKEITSSGVWYDGERGKVNHTWH